MFDFFSNDLGDSFFTLPISNMSSLEEEDLFQVMPNKSIYIGATAKISLNKTEMKNIRLMSKNIYNQGLFILDLVHMPVNVCGMRFVLYLFASASLLNQPAGEVQLIHGKFFLY
jgi:hypothetical protein